MSSKSKGVEIPLSIEDKNAQKTIKDINRELGKTEDAFEDAESAGKQMARAIEAATAQTITEIEQAERAVKAMETALDGVDMDPQQVVGDLKRMGLTLEEIETDAEDLARAVRGIDAVKVSADKAGLSDLNKVMGDTETKSRAASVGIGGIGGSISELPGIGNLGPIAESVGQLAEGALEGDVNSKQLVGTLGLLGGTAAAMWVVSKAMTSIAETKAFNREQAENYRQTIEEVGEGIEAVKQNLDDLRAVEGRTGGIGGLFESTTDIVPVLNDLAISQDRVNTAIAEGGEEFDTLIAELQGYKDAAAEAQRVANNTGDAAGMRQASEDVRAYGDAIDVLNEHRANYTAGAGAAAEANERWGQTEEEVAAAADEAADKLERQTEVIEGHRDALAESTDALEEQLDAQLSLADSSYALEKAQFDLTDTVTEANKVFGDAEASADDYRKAELDVIDAANDVAAAEIRKREETAKANGTTLTAKQRVDALNSSLLGQASTLNGPARQAILDHITKLNGIPPEKATEIQAAVDAGDLATAEALINGASRTRNTAIGVSANQWDLANLDAQINGIINRPRSVRFTAVGANRAAARGTEHAAAGSWLVGEEGPEVVNLDHGDTVTPAGASADALRGGGGSVVNNYVTQHFPAGTRPTDVKNATRKYERVQGPL